MKIKTLDGILNHTIQDLYSAENQILKALDKMVKRASSTELKKNFEKHYKETEKQVQRLEQAMKELDIKPKRAKCKGIEGIIKEGQELIRNIKESVRDEGLVASALKVEHYEISTYNSAIKLAEGLKKSKIQKLLEESLGEEEETEKKLSSIPPKSTN